MSDTAKRPSIVICWSGRSVTRPEASLAATLPVTSSATFRPSSFPISARVRVIVLVRVPGCHATALSEMSAAPFAVKRAVRSPETSKLLATVRTIEAACARE